jgi:putative PIN family toxin of toxin-antitoxin system
MPPSGGQTASVGWRKSGRPACAGVLMAAVRRVVLDTNVLVAAAYNPRSASRRVVEACLGGELTPVLSPALRREYGFVLARAARGRPYLGRIRRLLDGAEVVEPAQTPRVVPEDPGDDKLVAAARAARAVLVTNDTHLLALASSEGLQVMRLTDVPAH